MDGRLLVIQIILLIIRDAVVGATQGRPDITTIKANNRRQTMSSMKRELWKENPGNKTTIKPKIETSKILDNLLEGYSKANAPSSPTNIELGVFVININAISAQSMDFELNFYLRQRWNDPRLRFLSINNTTKLETPDGTWNDIWVSDIHVRNEKHGRYHYITIPNRLMWIYPDGTVYYAMKITLTLSCPMKLHAYPLDTQVCSMEFESFGHTTESIAMYWFNGTKKPVETSKKMTLMEFELVESQSSDCSAVYLSGTFPCLRASFILRRDNGFYMTQVYIPTILVVILSWVAFWIADDAVPARVTIGLLTVLTMTTMSSAAKQNLPRVSYIKAIDVWFSTCLIFVFAALVEFAFVNVLARMKNAKRALTLNALLSPTLTEPPALEGRNTNSRPLSGVVQKRHTAVDMSEENSKPLTTSQMTVSPVMRFANAQKKAMKVTASRQGHKMDRVSRWAFPLAFAIFNCFYWVFYLFVMVSEAEEMLKK